MPDASDRAVRRTGGQLLVEALRAQGVDAVFCVPGESFLPVLDALYETPQIALYVCRHEGAAANMAEAYGKLTGRPGICLVTRGPGATHASVGIHTAQQDSTPLILFVGQVARGIAEREAFQEMDLRRAFGPMAKWASQIEQVGRIPEFVSRAFHTALSGRAGPVVLGLPEDVLDDETDAVPTGPHQAIRAHPCVTDVARLREMLARAQRPLVMLGGSGWSADACRDLKRFVTASDLPVACAFRFQDLFDNRDPRYVGDVGLGINPKLAQRIREADLLLVLGARLGEATTSGYTLLSVPRPAQLLIHAHAGAEELGRVYQADLMINAAMPPLAAALAGLEPISAPAWSDWTRAAHADHAAWVERRTVPGPVQMWDIMEFLRGRLPEDAIVTNGAGNYSLWVHRFFRYPGFRTQLAPTSGAMGYGVPAAIAAKAVHRDRMVVSFSGDGCFLMYGQELATAVQYALPIVFIVVNNGMYGTIRMHQERHYPSRVIGSQLVNPNFAEYARAFGAHGEVVEDTGQFAPAFERSVASRKPAVIEVRLDPQAITPTTTIDAIRRQAQASRG